MSAMWILCVLIRFFQLIILLMLSGVLFSIAAISRLMEIIIIVIHPTAVFLLRQSAHLIILSTILAARMTSLTYRELCELVKCVRQEAVSPQETLREPLQEQMMASLQIGMQTTFVSCEKSTLVEIKKFPSVEDGSIAGASADDRIIEPPQDQLQDLIEMENLIENDISDY